MVKSLYFGNAQTVAGSVVYTKPDSTIEAKEDILKLLKDEALIRKIEIEPMYEIISAINVVNNLPPFFKNDSFREEKEFRIVIQPNFPFENVKFRVNKYGLTPYLEIKANGNMFNNGRLPLKSIKIGPCKERGLMADGIQFLLQSKGYMNVSYSFTEAPFRG